MLPKFHSAPVFLVVGILLGGVACSASATGTGGAGDGGAGSSGSSGSSGSTGNRAHVDPTPLCDKVVNQCKDTSTTIADCESVFGISRFTPECAADLQSATCADLTASNSALYNTCFPPCTGLARSCNSDGTITSCSEGRTHVFDCAGVCAQAGSTYTGQCSTNCGTASPDGQPQCCCGS